MFQLLELFNTLNEFLFHKTSSGLSDARHNDSEMKKNLNMLKSGRPLLRDFVKNTLKKIIKKK